VPTTDPTHAVRHSVALSRQDHFVHFRISGAGAFEAADRVFSRELYVRDGQISQGLLLEEDGTVFADCLLANDEGDYFMLTEGPDPETLRGYLARHFDGIGDVTIEDVGARVGIIGVDGPYAWELIARLVGPEVIGLPFLTFFHFDDVVCCRAGKTGEYGYLILAPLDTLPGLWDELISLGTSLDVGTVDLAALDSCALENWFFNIRAEGRFGLTPLELQLQWRVSRQKPYIGSAALERRREEGIRRRLTCLASPSELAVEDTVLRDGAEIGVVLNAGRSPVRGEWVGLALLDLAYALPGVDALHIGEARGARSITPPVIANRSLYVNPQVHSYASREDDDFPPLFVP